MRKYLFVATLAMPFCSLSTDPKKPKTFEINKQNCNLPMRKIRQLLPKPTDRQQAIKHCMEKAIEERWQRQNNLLTNQ